MDNKRVLIVDDNSSIHEDYRKILAAVESTQVDSAALFLGESTDDAAQPVFHLTSAFQGAEAVELVKESVCSGTPFAVAFVDMRMPPGMDGLQTIEEMWTIDPDLQVVICSAYSDHSWQDIWLRLGETDQLLILKKPFERSEVSQITVALTEKWRLTQQTRKVSKANFEQLTSTENTLTQRNRHLELATDLVGMGYCQLDLATNKFESSYSVRDIFRVEPDGLNTLDDFLGLLDSSKRASIAEMFRHATESGTEFQFKSRTQLPNNETGHVQVRFICEKGVDGEKTSLFGVVQDVTENEEAIQAVKHASMHDSLTRLANRARLMQELNDFSWTESSIASLILVDVDQFKAVNDTLGHGVGDDLLKEIGVRLKRAARPCDTVARLGADEFAIFQRDLDSTDQTLETTQRFLQQMQTPIQIRNQVVRGSASCGIASFPEQAKSVQDLMKKADLALYLAKNEERGSYRVYNSAIDESIRLRREIEAELNLALDRDQLKLYYQPIVETGEGKIVAMEALIRWIHPIKGIIPPFDFIPIAEERGSIIPIGRWVIHQACLDAIKWAEYVSVSVNVSAVQLVKKDFLSSVVGSLQQTKLAPNRLELEITETVFLEDTEQILSTLHGLRELGIRIVMDDFGIGHSSLSYLRQFPFDKIKLDKSFLLESLESRESKAIITAVSSLGRSLGVQTCAEGVETEKHLTLARDEGYTHCQGYYFGRPQPVDMASQVFETVFHLPAERQDSLTSSSQ